MALGDDLRKTTEGYTKIGEIENRIHYTFNEIKNCIERQAPRAAQLGHCSFTVENNWYETAYVFIIHLDVVSSNEVEHALAYFNRLLNDYKTANKIHISYSYSLSKGKRVSWGKRYINIHVDNIVVSW